MVTNKRRDGGEPVRVTEPRVRRDAHGVVCYCGLYESCPQWDRMTDDQRRTCSADKRATIESFWKTGLRGG
jgi:hypothetical protein